MSPGRIAVLLLIGALVLGGCGSSGGHAEAPPSVGAAGSARGSASASASTSSTLRYVALGDSYSAAPGVPTLLVANGCMRSTHDYPHLLAAAVPALKLRDVTCSGATISSLVTRQVTSPQLKLSVPPQLDALSRRTRYVTLSLGGNDEGLYAGLLGCLGPQGCPAALRAGVDATLDHIRAHLTDALAAIHAKAPSATVAVVGYPQLIPESGSCPQLGVTDASRAFVHAVFVKLSQRMEQAAKAGGARYVDVLSASKGHDLCSSSPWINGPQDTGQAIAFHPFLAEQEAVARLVQQALS